MNNTIYDLLLISSFDLDGLIEDYRLFFMSLMPGMFIFACLIEYFDRMNAFGLVKRALIAVLIMSTVSSFYKTSIKYSIDTANTKFESQKGSNILLMDMFSASSYFDDLESNKKDRFFKDNGIVGGSLKFIKYHLFDSFINDGFTIGVYFLSKLCFILIKVVYSLVYYLGYGLIGIPVLIYLFPTMGNVLRGSILTYLWCLIVPHVLVFVLSMIGSEINKGYEAGQIIGGSASGTALLFILTLFIAFTPFITMMLINGSGLAHAGGIISMVGGTFIRSLPMRGINTAATLMTGGSLGPKSLIASKVVSGGAKTTMRGFNFAGTKLSNSVNYLKSNNKSSSSLNKSQNQTKINSSNGLSHTISRTNLCPKNTTNLKENSNEKQYRNKSKEAYKSRSNDQRSQTSNRLHRSHRRDFKYGATNIRNHNIKAKRNNEKV